MKLISVQPQHKHSEWVKTPIIVQKSIYTACCTIYLLFTSCLYFVAYSETISTSAELWRFWLTRLWLAIAFTRSTNVCDWLQCSALQKHVVNYNLWCCSQTHTNKEAFESSCLLAGQYSLHLLDTTIYLDWSVYRLCFEKNECRDTFQRGFLLFYQKVLMA